MIQLIIYIQCNLYQLKFLYLLFNMLLYYVCSVDNGMTNEDANKLPMILATLQPKQSLPDMVYDKIAAVHNSSKSHWGQRLTRKRLNDPSITDRMISQFIRQCPCCQVMSRIHLQIKTHPLTCASYNPFEVLHLDHIGPLRLDAKGHTFIPVIIDAFSRWVELYPTTTTTAVETASYIFQHFDRFGNPDVIIEELLRMTGVEQSSTTAYSS